MIRDMNGGRCFLCGDLFEDTDAKGFVLSEMAEDQWETICVPCDLVCELDAGK